MTNFDDEMLSKINDLLVFVTENTACDFYRKKYGEKTTPKICSLHDFQKNIPLLSKDEFINLPVEQRIFSSPEQIIRYSFSSGTVNSENITIMPNHTGTAARQESIEPFEYGEKLLNEGLAKKIMLVWPIMSSAFTRHLLVQRKGILIVPADVHNLELSAQIAKKIEIDGLISTSTILYFFLEKLKDAQFDLSKIKWVSLGGEFCSEQKLQYFKEMLPNAFFSFRFGSSEIRGRGYRCQHLAQKPPNVFHPSPFGLIEINNPDKDGFGEIIHTTLNPRPFPLIRYRTGDIASLEKKRCECGCEYLLTLHGKGELDTLKISGVTLHIQTIENALDAIREYVRPQFQMHVYEKKIGKQLKIQLELHLSLKPNSEALCDDAVFSEIAIAKISNNLKLSSKATLTDLVEQEIFLPLQIVFKKDWEQSRKEKHIISHME